MSSGRCGLGMGVWVYGCMGVWELAGVYVHVYVRVCVCVCMHVHGRVFY